VPHQVRQEEDRALEHADQEQVPALVVAGDLLAEFADTAFEVFLGDESFTDRLWRHGGQRY